MTEVSSPKSSPGAAIDNLERVPASDPQDEFSCKGKGSAGKREQILRGAMQVFLNSGYAGTSMDRVAVEAGVSKQTIYSHFQDKEGLFTALIERVTIQRFQLHFSADFCHEQPRVLLRQLAETFLEKLDDPEFLAFIRLVIAESARFPELAKLYMKTVVQYGYCKLGHYFEQHPNLRIEDPEATARIFFGAIAAFVLSQGVMHGQEVMPMDKERLVNSLIHLILNPSQSEG